MRFKLNQSNIKIRLKRNNGTWFEQTIENFPGAVQNHELVVLADQQIYVEADISGEQLINFLEVDHIGNPEKTIVAYFRQHDNGAMILSLSHPFKKDVQFDLEVLRLGGDHFEATTSLPVRAGVKLSEMWPEPISMVVIKNARFIESNASDASALASPKSGNILFEEVERTGKLSWIWWTVMAVLFISMIGKLFFKK